MQEVPLLDGQYCYLIVCADERGILCLYTHSDANSAEDEVGLCYTTPESIYASVTVGVEITDPYRVLAEGAD